MINRFEINLANANEYVEGKTYSEILARELRREGFYSKNFLFSFFDWSIVEQVEQTGNYRKSNPDSIFALTKEELEWTSEKGLNDVKSLTDQYKTPGVVVYDIKKFEQSKFRHEYFFKDKSKKLESLIGIGKLIF